MLKKAEKVSTKRITLTPFEKGVDLKTMLRIQRGDQKVGAFVCEKDGGKYRFVLGFECKGIHSYISAQEAELLFEGVEAGLKDLPAGELVTFHMGSFASDTARQQELQQLIKNTSVPELQFLALGEQARVQELTRQGLRKPKFLRIYVTCTIEPKTQGAADGVEKILALGLGWWNSFKGTRQLFEQKYLQDMALEVASVAKRWHQFFDNKMGLEVQAMTDVQLWEMLWRRLNNSKPIEVPQVLILDDAGLREEINCEVHAKSLLVAKEPPQVPKNIRHWVKVKGKYVGALTFLAKPAGWVNELGQLRYFWESLFSRDEITDTEVFIQLSAANQAMVRTDAQRLLKQSNVVAFNAEKKRSIDVAAQIKVQRSVDAQGKLYEGQISLYTAVTILVHRPTTEALDRACDHITSCFRLPAWVQREREYPWKLWLDTLQIVYNPQLTKPFDRRKIYLSSEVPGLMSLIQTRSADKQGLELVAEDGGTPIHIDIFNQHRNVAIFGATGSGKSVLVSYFLVQALIRNWACVGVDFPRQDGTSTYTDLFKYLGKDRAAYFDISKGSNNFFQRPDLRRFSPHVRQERMNDFNDFLLSGLMAMVVGKSDDPSLTKTTRSILGRALNKYNADEEINRRHEEAISCGFGPKETHPAWHDVPTLRDFLPFCDMELLSLDAGSEDIRKALSSIKLSINFWLESRVGKAIGSPSSFPTDAQTIMYALRGISNDEDAAVCALSATSAALVKTLESSDSLFLLDEGSVLFEYADLAKMIGRFCATGRKSGMRVILISQDPNTIAKSVAGQQIFQNVAIKLTGRIETMAVKSFEEFFEYRHEIIARNATDSFFPKASGIYSRWLLDYGGVFTIVRFYPSKPLLGVVANNVPEQKARNWFSQRYPNDKFEALAYFSDYLAASIQEGQPPFELVDEPTPLPEQPPAKVLLTA